MLPRRAPLAFAVAGARRPTVPVRLVAQPLAHRRREGVAVDRPQDLRQGPRDADLGTGETQGSDEILGQVSAKIDDPLQAAPPGHQGQDHQGEHGGERRATALSTSWIGELPEQVEEARSGVPAVKLLGCGSRPSSRQKSKHRAKENRTALKASLGAGCQPSFVF
jgi:hypothetical protein